MQYVIVLINMDMMALILTMSLISVSYTHLDVYKRQL